MEYSELSNKELYDKLNKALYAKKAEESGLAALMREGAARVAEIAERILCYKTDLSDIGKTARLVERIKFYKFEYARDFDILKFEGERAFEELQRRDDLFGSNTRSGAVPGDSRT